VLPRRYNLATIWTEPKVIKQVVNPRICHGLRGRNLHLARAAEMLYYSQMRIISQRRYVRSSTSARANRNAVDISAIIRSTCPPLQFDSSQLRPILIEYSPNPPGASKWFSKASLRCAVLLPPLRELYTSRTPPAFGHVHLIPHPRYRAFKHERRRGVTFNIALRAYANRNALISFIACAHNVAKLYQSETIRRILQFP